MAQNQKGTKNWEYHDKQKFPAAISKQKDAAENPIVQRQRSVQLQEQGG